MQLFDGLDRYQLFSGSFARKLAKGCVLQPSQSRLKHAPGNVSKNFVERAYLQSRKWLEKDYSDKVPNARVFKLPGVNFQKAACTGVVATLVGDKMHMWQMGDALWAILRLDRKQQPPRWICRSLATPKYVATSTVPDCELSDMALIRKIKAARDAKQQLTCGCESGHGREVHFCGQPYKIQCIPRPKILSFMEKDSLNDACTDIADVQHDDLVIMGKPSTPCVLPFYSNKIALKLSFIQTCCPRGKHEIHTASSIGK